MANGINSPRASFFTALVIGMGVFAIATISDVLGITLNPLWSLADDVALGLFVGAIVLVYDRRRRRDLHAKLSNIHEINHHIRNQLEVIEYSAWATHDQQHMARIHESVKHIDWALREILGREEDEQEAPAPAPFPPQSVRPDEDAERMASE